MDIFSDIYLRQHLDELQNLHSEQLRNAIADSRYNAEMDAIQSSLSRLGNPTTQAGQMAALMLDKAIAQAEINGTLRAYQ